MGYSGYKNHFSKSKTVSPSPIAPTNSTSSWKVYTNLKYGFTFEFPPNFSNQGAISGPSTGVSTGLISLTDPATVKFGSDAPFDGFSVYIVTDLKGLTFDKYIAKEIQSMNAAKYTGMRNPIQTEGINGTRLISRNGQQAYYYFPTPDKKMIVVFAYLESKPAFKQTFDQVLASFRFTN